MSNNEVRCYIGLGSNLSGPVEQLTHALDSLAHVSGITLSQVSPFYTSKPMGPQDQPDYVNAVAEIVTRLSPHRLLDCLQAIEQQQGRLRLQHWGARTVDLDLLLYGEQQIHDDRLTVPHPGIAERDFVLRPLSDLVPPDFTIPGVGVIEQLLANCPSYDLIRL